MQNNLHVLLFIVVLFINSKGLEITQMFINKGLIKYILVHHTMKYSESVKQNEEGLHTLNMK